MPKSKPPRKQAPPINGTPRGRPKAKEPQVYDPLQATQRLGFFIAGRFSNNHSLWGFTDITRSKEELLNSDVIIQTPGGAVFEGDVVVVTYKIGEVRDEPNMFLAVVVREKDGVLGIREISREFAISMSKELV